MLNYINILMITLCLSFFGQGAVAAVPAYVQLHASGELEAGRKDPAREIIHAIVASVGLKPNFEIKEAKISNAAAVNYKGKRYILYDAKFMKRIQNATQTDWAAVSILAHEIGHHLNGHTMMGKGHDKPALELEADEFSGFVLRQMGASLADAQKAMQVMSGEKGSASHPGKNARIAAIERGYISANDRILASAEKPLQKMVATHQEEEKVEEQPTYPLGGEQLFKEVHFRTMPDRTFYLTKELKLVALTEKGPAVFGNISKNRNRLMLNVQGSKGATKSFYVSSEGALVNEANQVVGYIRNPA